MTSVGCYEGAILGDCPGNVWTYDLLYVQRHQGNLLIGILCEGHVLQLQVK